jgi:hypothetical protein
VTPKAVYLKLPLLSQVAHKDWARISFSDATSFGGLDLGQYAGRARQLQPQQYLALLASSAKVRPAGTATIDGVVTRHYTGSVDLRSALASVPDAAAGWSRLAAGEGLRSAHLDAWLDAANRPRKLAMSVGSAVLTVTVTLHLSGFGAAVQVTPPTAGHTLDLTHGLLGTLG